MVHQKNEITIIGGGAAGFFIASNIRSSSKRIQILEQAKTPLQKVKASGGGRCNITNACFEPRDLKKYYPRGGKELLSVFHNFQPADTISWFEKRGLALKIEADRRVFPVSNNSQDVVGLLCREALKHAEVKLNCAVQNISYHPDGFLLETTQGKIETDILIITTGNAKPIWKIMEKLGHTIVPPVPSLFTFHIANKKLHELSGISLPHATIYIPELKAKESGALLITHWGVSGPAVLKLSSVAARALADCDYKFNTTINWLSESCDSVCNSLIQFKNRESKKRVHLSIPFDLPKRFWLFLLDHANIDTSLNWQQVSKSNIQKLAENITGMKLPVTGKSVNKDEFVTAGGVALKEIDFKTMQSKIVPKLYFAGEVLDIDAVTGGFNFQACWSEGFIIAKNF